MEYKVICPECKEERSVSKPMYDKVRYRQRTGKCWNCAHPKKKRMVQCPDCKGEREVSKMMYDHIRKGRCGARCWECGKNYKQAHHNTEEYKAGARERTINRMKDRGILLGCINYNPKAVDFIEEMFNSLPYPWKFQHAKNGGEFLYRGYYADGYCKEYNVWFEYDEPSHFDKDGNLKQKDRERMEEIIKYLGCSFWRWNEESQELHQYNPRLLHLN